MPNPARWLNDNVPGWRQLEDREKKAIGDFAVMWSFFELNSTSRYGRPNATPYNISRAVTDLEPEPHFDRFEAALNYFAARYIDGEDYTEHWHPLRVHRDYIEGVRHGLVGQNSTNREAFLAVLLIVNRLRNNFLHGEKARYDFADQFWNFTHANNVLIYALELWPSPQEY